MEIHPSKGVMIPARRKCSGAAQYNWTAVLRPAMNQREIRMDGREAAARVFSPP